MCHPLYVVFWVYITVQGKTASSGGSLEEAATTTAAASSLVQTNTWISPPQKKYITQFPFLLVQKLSSKHYLTLHRSSGECISCINTTSAAASPSLSYTSGGTTLTGLFTHTHLSQNTGHNSTMVAAGETIKGILTWQASFHRQTSGFTYYYTWPAPCHSRTVSKTLHHWYV